MTAPTHALVARPAGVPIVTTPHDTPGGVVVDSRRESRAALATWVARFAELWDAPAGRLDEVMDLLGPDVRLVAPGAAVTVGRAAGHAAFARTLGALPDLRADVHGWAGGLDAVFLDMTFAATIGGRRVTWPNVDRVRFADGYAVERTAFFDPTRVRRAFLRSPAGWRQLRRLRRRA